ncbi:MAG: sensor histidine kinase [Draconibacterium sp.]
MVFEQLNDPFYKKLLELDNPASLIAVNPEGNIVGTKIGAGDYFDLVPEINSNIDDFFPGGSGYIGIKAPIELLRIRFNNSGYLNIYIKCINDLTWFGFKKAHELSISQKQKIEKGNRELLYNRKLNENIIKLALRKLDTVVLEQIEGPLFHSVSENPPWFKKLLIHEQLLETIPLSSIPFLDFFYNNFLISHEPVRKDVHSDIWAQTISPNLSIYLRATGFQNKGLIYIILHPLHTGHNISPKELLQKGREQALNLRILQKSSNEIQCLLNTKEGFYSSIAQDLRSSFVAINSTIEIVVDEMGQKKELQENTELLRLMKKESDFLIEYSNKMRHWLKFEKEAVKLNLERLSFKKILLSVFKQLQEQCTDNVINFRIGQVKAPNVKGDKHLLTTAFLSLLETPSGGFPAPRHIEIVIEADNLTIKDTMPQLVNSEYVGSGSRLLHADRAGKPSELNLYVAKKTCALHGFSLDCSTGKGINQYIICFAM